MRRRGSEKKKKEVEEAEEEEEEVAADEETDLPTNDDDDDEEEEEEYLSGGTKMIKRFSSWKEQLKEFSVEEEKITARFDGKLEVSKSSKSECLSCTKKIDKDELRVKKKPGGGYVHLNCFHPFGRALLTEDKISGLETMDGKQKKNVLKWLSKWNKTGRHVVDADTAAPAASELLAIRIAKIDCIESCPILILHLSFLDAKALARVAQVSKLCKSVCCLSVCLSVCLSIYLSVYLSVCLSICLSFS